MGDSFQTDCYVCETKIEMKKIDFKWKPFNLDGTDWDENKITSWMIPAPISFDDSNPNDEDNGYSWHAPGSSCGPFETLKEAVESYKHKDDPVPTDEEILQGQLDYLTECTGSLSRCYDDSNNVVVSEWCHGCHNKIKLEWQH